MFKIERKKYIKPSSKVLQAEIKYYLSKNFYTTNLGGIYILKGFK